MTDQKSEKVKSVFETLYAIDVSGKTKEKNGLTYLPWSSAWAETKKIYPNATFKTIPQIMDEFGNTRPWHDDGKTGWVEVAVTIERETITESLPIMDFKNKSIPVENITSTDANKALKRCLVKCLALFGMATFIFEGEDLPEVSAKILDLQTKCYELIQKKVGISAEAKKKVGELCKEADRKANPDMPEELIKGNPMSIDDENILSGLHKHLLAIR